MYRMQRVVKVVAVVVESRCDQYYVDMGSQGVRLQGGALVPRRGSAQLLYLQPPLLCCWYRSTRRALSTGNDSCQRIVHWFRVTRFRILCMVVHKM